MFALLCIKFDNFVKSQTQRICHFDRRKKSYVFIMLHRKDFSHSFEMTRLKTFYETVKFGLTN